MRNLHNTTKQELLYFLKSIDSKLSRKIIIIAIGGTALTLLNLKPSTRDIDFDLPYAKDKNALTSLFGQLDFEQESFSWFTSTGLRIDVFSQGYIFCTQLPPDYIEKAKVAVKLDNILLKTLSLEDIIITKLGRGDERDFEDIKQIYLHADIKNEELAARFFRVAESWTDSPQVIKQKLLDLFEIKFGQWGFSIPIELIKKVKLWEI